MPVLTIEEIEIIKEGSGNANWVVQLCNSHEELRKERDRLIHHFEREVIVDKCTIREFRRSYGVGG